MKKSLRIFSFIFFLQIIFSGYSFAQKQYDICVYGGSSAGVIAAYSAKKLGKTVILIEPGKRLGGLTSGGLGFTDIGNKYAISGLSLDFYRRLGKHYGKFEQWIFEPSVAERTFWQYMKEGQVPVLFQHRLKDVKKVNGSITEIIIEKLDGVNIIGSEVIQAKIFMDCTYEGDLMAKAGVLYTVGREANDQYNETYNGVQLREKHQFPDGIDPYKIPGDPSSGLVWGVSTEPLAPKGSGDKKVQAYNFRICLTNKPSNRIPITRPDDYDSTRYELLLRYVQKVNPKDLWAFLKFDLMPNGKTDINNNGPFSTDMIGMNYNYPEADYGTRVQIQKKHENYNKGLLYFIGHDSRMPKHLREMMLQWGYPKDEYIGNNHWSPQMYVREARRMVGAYVMTQANCEGKVKVEDGVGMAAYTMDSHNCQRIVVEENGVRTVKNEGDVQIGGFGPYPISYRSIIPRADDCTNLFVPVCLSATHIAYGSIRMEPVFMVLAQSAAVAASYAIDNNKSVQEVDVVAVQTLLKENPLLDGSTPDILVDEADVKSVSVTGVWKKETRGSYGPSMLVSDSSAVKNAVRFSPEIRKSGKYTVYAYFPRVQGMAKEVNIVVHNGSQTASKRIQPHAIKVEGQTSGEWVLLGTYSFAEGKEAYVEIGSEGTNGVIVADAVLLRAGK
jgi:hypothetical protein